MSKSDVLTKTMDEFSALVTSNYATNAARGISASDVREVENEAIRLLRRRLGVDIVHASDFGIIGDFYGNHDGIYDAGTRTLTSDTYTFDSQDIGKELMYNGQQTTVEDVSGGNAITVDTLTSAGASAKRLWYVGTDESDLVRTAMAQVEALDAKFDISSEVAAIDQWVPVNGGLFLENKDILMSNSSARYSAGNVGAIMLPPRGAIFGGLAPSRYHGSLVASENEFYGWMFATTSASENDFMDIANLRMVGYGSFTPNSSTQEGAILLDIKSGTLKQTDSWNRIFNVHGRNFAGTGVTIRGRGEFAMHDVSMTKCAEYGFLFDANYDYRATQLTAASCGYNGICFASSGAAYVSTGKVYYCGGQGGSDTSLSSGIALTGNQTRNGFVNLSNFEIQETRGGSIYINSGFNQITALGCGDPGRAAVGTQSGFPTVIAGVYLDTNASQNILDDIKVSPSVEVYEDQNSDDSDGKTAWNNATHGVYVAGDDGDADLPYGPQNNIGTITVSGALTTVTNGIENGLSRSHNSGFTPYGGDGCFNGLNPALNIAYLSAEERRRFGSITDVSGLVSSACFDLDATNSSSYSGSGTNWANLVASPADSALQTDYDFTATGVTFTGTAGSSKAYWSFDGTGDYFTSTVTNTATTTIAHRTTGGSASWYAICFDRPTGATGTFFSTENGGLGIKIDDENIYITGDTGTATLTGYGRYIKDGTNILIVSLAANLGEHRVWVNGNSHQLERGMVDVSFSANASTTDRTAASFYIGAEDSSTNLLSNGYKLIAVSGGNGTLDDVDAANILGMYSVRHSRNYKA